MFVYELRNKRDIEFKTIIKIINETHYIRKLIKRLNSYIKITKSIMIILNLTKVANVAFDTTYQKYWLARFLSSLCLGTLSVCVAWQIYDISRNPLHLGLVGLIMSGGWPLLIVIGIPIALLNYAAFFSLTKKKILLR